MNKIRLNGNINLRNSVKGLYPFIIASNISKDKRQLIILNNRKNANDFYNHIIMLNENYKFLNPENDFEFSKLIAFTLEKEISFITTNDIYDKLFPHKTNIKKISIKKNLEIDNIDIIKFFDEFDFERVDNVYERGEYAVRGSIIDIYDYINQPVRIEFDFDMIKSIRYFDIEKQTSLREINFIEFYYMYGKYDKKYNEFFHNYKTYDIEDIEFNSNINTDISEKIIIKGKSISDFIKWTKKYDKYKILIYASNDYEKKRLENIFGNKYKIFPYNIYEGFIFHKDKIININDFEIFKRNRIFKIHDSISQIPIETVEALQHGDIVVHQIYGIGRFAGIERVSLGNRETDCLKIYYKNNDKLFVPVDQIFMVDKYYSVNKNINLSPLSKSHFAKQKKRIKESLKQIAGELLRLYAEREIIKGHKFPEDDEMQFEMEEHFEFNETEDQIKTIEDVKRDMQSEKIMDRLICGEVGYGKTEVAARAAFKCVLDNKQVIFLVPTTILAEQHYRNLSERLMDYPINIAMYSRFTKLKEKNKIKEELKIGKIDIIVGTHGLLSDTIEYKELGLLIIDEEHRFGVRQKEKIADIKRDIDILYMSATPIPRTLEMVFSSIKDISNITTPPVGRKPVNTYIIHWDKDIIKNAILYEIARNGQIYFVHNRIETLKSIEQKIKNIVPNCRTRIAHAKLKAKDLENIMIDFWEHKFDLLLSTAIIESGIDNPNANTMIINRGDMFGLAQLHQLRGRIGRSKREAFCYIIIPSKSSMSLNAKRRLTAFKSYSSLGAGMKLAMKDLEIRGAGNLLGTKQHGNIGIVGFTLYFKLLKQAIDEIKGIKSVEIIEPIINMPIKTYIPDEFNLSKSGKTHLYREISSISDLKNIEIIKTEFYDKYGKLPEEILNMFYLQEIKILCKKAKVSKININNNEFHLEFFINYEVKLTKLNNLLSSIENRFEIKYKNPFKIIIFFNKPPNYKTIKTLLKKLL